MNKTIELHIKKSGLQTLIQDGGRIGYEAFGVPVSGVMDETAYQIANWLVANPSSNPVLEITLLGPTIKFKNKTQIAITGADLSPKINGEAIPLDQTIDVAEDGILSFGAIKNGCRAYLAIRGEWEIKKWLGSFSALPFDDGNATPDSFLPKGKILTIKKHDLIPPRKISEEHYPIFENPSIIKVLPAPEFELFSRKNIAEFFSKTFMLTSESNRMGYKSNQQLSDFQPLTEVISSGIVPGTIQITHAGQPIILMKDAQTSGGYFRLANVISANMDKLAQLKPNDEIRFEMINLEEAIYLKQKKKEWLEGILKE